MKKPSTALSKKLLTMLLLLLSACAFQSQAQEQRPAPPLAQKIDEFGNVAFSDMLARLDTYAIALQNQPNATGMIAVYSQMSDKLPGWYLRRAYWGKGYLTKARGLAEGRVRVVNGGFRDDVTFQLWLIPPGALAPVVPLDWAEALSREKRPILFDLLVFENYRNVPEVYEYEDYTEPKEKHEPFISALRANPAARGLIIAYATRRKRRGTDRTLAAREKLSLMKLHSIGAERIVALGGGLRTHKTIEYWLVPPGAELPKPTPEARAARRKRR